MYKVKVDEKLLCFTGSVNGMEYVTDPDVKLVVNGVDSFSFAIYPQHPLYKEIECKVSRVKIWRDSKLLFYGEVTGYSQDMYGIRTYDCEGALAWLNDLHFAYAISGATPKEVLYWYIKLYNQKLRDKSKSFELGTVTVHKALTQSGTEGTIARSSGVYPSFWEEIQDKLLDSFGGILRVRYVGSDTCAGYIDWLEIPDGTCSQDVRYAKNLLNCDWTYNCTALATAVVPLGKRKDSSGDNEVRLTIDKADDDDATFMIQYMTGTDDLVKSGNMVYSKSRMEKYGLIQQAVTFDDITDAGTLAYQGAVWLRQNGKAASTIRAEAIDLADIDESVEHFTHGDYVRTKLPGDSAESLFPITAIEIPIAAPENAKLTVGTQESGITSGSGGQGGGSIADAGSGADAMAHTHSNKGVLDKITEQDYADFKGAVNKAHVHSNKGTLDKIDETAWLTVYGQSHEHENKEVLDQITQTEWIAINSAKNKAHTHDNKDTLDKIDDVSWLTVYGQTHEHSNKAVLDKLTVQDYSDFKGTVNKAHVHSNKGTLDKIDETSWLLVYGQTHEHENQSVLNKTTASYTDAEKTKLAGIAAGANKYVHPTTSGNKHIPSGGSSGQILRWSADGTAVWGADNNTTYGDATQSAHGLMTAADKKKLDGMDLSKYLPKSGGVMTGDIDMQANKRDILVGTHKATTSDGTAVAGGSITTSGYVGDKLKAARSFVGTVTGNDGVWWDVISVRHRNGYTDGVNYGMYLFSKLASTGNLSWNKQIAANTWQGDRTLLDSVNYSDYAAPLSHTHKNIDSIGNVGYYGSDKASTNGWYKFYSGTLTGYNDRTARLMLTYMYGYNNFGTIFFHARCNNGNTIQIKRLLWEVRSGFEDGDVVAVAKGNDYSLYVYNRNPQWGRIKIRVLESGGTSSDWDMTLASNFTKESTAPTPTIVASDGCTVANATTWNGLINDVDTYNSSDTWILVKKDNRIQHRYAGELDVNSAKTLTDSGWVTCPLAVTGKTTYPSSSSSIKVRKYGKLVRLEAMVKYTTVFGTGHNVATIPEGYRPSVLQREHGIISTATEKIFFDATLGVGGSLSFAPAGSGSSTFNPANSYECRMTYFID